VAIETFAGDRLRVELSSTAQEAYKYGFHEADLTMACLLLLQPGSVFVDIGANFGYFSVLGSKLVGRAGRVYAFEPTPRTFGVLQQNTSGLVNVTIECAAVASGPGFATLRDYGSEYSGFNTVSNDPRTSLRLKARATRVPTLSLDDYFRNGPRPNFVKIDAENAEMDILAGMNETLREARPVVSLEFGDSDDRTPSRSQALMDFMCSRGYQPFEIIGTQLQPHKPLPVYDFVNLIFSADSE
jgi:FkbM family methyltransferase